MQHRRLVLHSCIMLTLDWCIMTTNEREALRHHAVLKGLKWLGSLSVYRCTYRRCGRTVPGYQAVKPHLRYPLSPRCQLLVYTYCTT